MKRSRERLRATRSSSTVHVESSLNRSVHIGSSQEEGCAGRAATQAMS